MESKINIEKYNKENIDITEIVFSDKFSISNYLNDSKASILIKLGIPCGAMQPYYKGKELSHRQEHRLSDEEIKKIRQMYVPINSIEELAKHKMTHFCSYTINPNYIKPEKMQKFMYRFNLLTDKDMMMFDESEIKRNQKEIFNNRPITYETISIMKKKYITKEKQEELLNKVGPKILTKEKFNELLNRDTNYKCLSESKNINEEMEM